MHRALYGEDHLPMDHRMPNGNILASGIDMLAVGKDDLSTAMACTNHVHHQQATLADVQ